MSNCASRFVSVILALLLFEVVSTMGAMADTLAFTPSGPITSYNADPGGAVMRAFDPKETSLHCSKLTKRPSYSITLSASASNFGGTSSPSVLAVLRLIASSKFVA
jgi:hypothetical protein